MFLFWVFPVVCVVFVYFGMLWLALFCYVFRLFVFLVLLFVVVFLLLVLTRVFGNYFRSVVCVLFCGIRVCKVEFVFFCLYVFLLYLCFSRGCVLCVFFSFFIFLFLYLLFFVFCVLGCLCLCGRVFIGGVWYFLVVC